MYTRPTDEETKVRISISYSIYAQMRRYTFYARIKLTARWLSALCRMYLRNASLLQRPAAFRAWSLMSRLLAMVAPPMRRLWLDNYTLSWQSRAQQVVYFRGSEGLTTPVHDERARCPTAVLHLYLHSSDRTGCSDRPCD